MAGADNQLDMSLLIERARKLGVTRMHAQGLLLANRMLDTLLPAALPLEMHRDRIVQSLLQLAIETLLKDERCWSTNNTPLSRVPAQIRYPWIPKM